MDLVISVVHRTTIIDVGLHAVDNRVRECPRRNSADHLPVDDLCRLADRVDEVTAIFTKGLPEGSRHVREVWRLRDVDTGLPRLEAIDICRFYCSTRVSTTWFAPVFDVDTEDDPLRVPFVGTRVSLRRQSANTCKDDGIGWRRTRHRSARPVIIRVAKHKLVRNPVEMTIRLVHIHCAAAQARTTERVEAALRRHRMEVHVDGVPRVTGALIVALVFPLATDAGVTEDDA